MDEIVFKSVVIDGVQYYSAYFSCPECCERGNRYPPSFWVHASCPDDHLYIGSDATLYCSGCGRKVKVLDAQYACPCHSSAEQSLVFLKGDNINVDAAYSVNVEAAMYFALPYTRGGRGWITDFLKALENQL